MFKKFRIFILKNESKKQLCHTDIINLASLHRMGFMKVDEEWVRKGGLSEARPTNEATATTTSEAPRDVTPPPVSESLSGSSSTTTITRADMQEMLANLEIDINDYVYGGQLDVINKINATYEEVVTLTHKLQLDMDKNYKKLQHIQDKIGRLVSFTTTNTVSPPDLFEIQNLLNEVLQGQVNDRSCIEQLVASLG